MAQTMRTYASFGPCLVLVSHPCVRLPPFVCSFGGGGCGHVVPLVIAGSRIFPCHSPFPPREQWLAVAVQGAVVDVVEVVVRRYHHRCSRTFIPCIPVPIPCFLLLSHPFFPRIVVVETCK